MLSTALIVSQRKWRCLKGAVLNIKFGPFYVFSRVFFTPPRYDYPLDATLVLWQYESRIRGGLLYTMSVVYLWSNQRLLANLTLCGLYSEAGYTSENTVL